MKYLAKLSDSTKFLLLVCIVNFIALFKVVDVASVLRFVVTFIYSVIAVYDNIVGFKNRTLKKVLCIIMLILLLIFMTYVFLFE